MNLKKVAIAVVLVVLWLGIGAKVHAQQADMEIVPSRLDLIIKPQATYSATFKITNYGDPATFVPKIMNAQPDGDTGILTPSKTAKTPLTFLFSHDKKDVGDPVFLQTNESVRIPVVIQADAGEERDYYYYFAAELQEPTTVEGKTAVELVPRIGVPIIATLSNTGEREVNAAISVFQIKPDYKLNLFGKDINFVETGRKLPVFFSIANLGSNVVSPDAKISVKGMLGSNAEFPILHRNVYAQSVRLMQTTSSYEKFCSNNESCSRFSLLLQGLLIGKYTVTAEVDLSGGAPKAYRSFTFVAFPFKASIGLIFFIGLYLILFKKKKVHHKRK